MPIDPATILHVLPKPGGREAVLLRRVADRLEITVAHVLPGQRYHADRSIGIGPGLLKAFAEAAPAAVGAVLAAGGAEGPRGREAGSTASAAEGIDR